MVRINSLGVWLVRAFSFLNSCILLIPIFVLVYVMPGHGTYLVAAMLFGLAAFTDWLDGYLARRLNQTTPFGAFLDPVADKLMVVIVLVMLVQAQSSLWEDVIAMIIIGREITVSALREWMATIGESATVKVQFSGKLKTTFQMFGIAFMVWQKPIFGIDIYRVGYILLILAAILTIYSMFAYLKAAWPSMREPE